MNNFNEMSNDELLDVDGGLILDPATKLYVTLGVFTVSVIAVGVYYCCKDE